MSRIAGRVRVSAFHCLLERQLARALQGRTVDRFSLSDDEYDENGRCQTRHGGIPLCPPNQPCPAREHDSWLPRTNTHGAAASNGLAGLKKSACQAS